MFEWSASITHAAAPTRVPKFRRVSERYHLNWRATVSAGSELLSSANPFLLHKINIYKGHSEREWKMQISSSLAAALLPSFR